MRAASCIVRALILVAGTIAYPGLAFAQEGWSLTATGWYATSYNFVFKRDAEGIYPVHPDTLPFTGGTLSYFAPDLLGGVGFSLTGLYGQGSPITTSISKGGPGEMSLSGSTQVYDVELLVTKPLWSGHLNLFGGGRYIGQRMDRRQTMKNGFFTWSPDPAAPNAKSLDEKTANDIVVGEIGASFSSTFGANTDWRFFGNLTLLGGSYKGSMTEQLVGAPVSPATKRVTDSAGLVYGFDTNVGAMYSLGALDISARYRWVMITPLDNPASGWLTHGPEVNVGIRF